MRVEWIGQAGLLIETKNKKILVDPYLSDSVKKVNPKSFRRIAVDEKYFKIKPDFLVLTHNHLDHTDKETLDVYFKEYSGITVLASYNAWENVRRYGGDNNYVMFNQGTVWTEDGIEFKAVQAEHSDDYAIGVMIYDGDERIYITGDTLFNEKIFENIKENVDILFLPINGVGNNMNMTDAARFAKKIAAKTVVPIHFGMFDEINPEMFECEGRVIPEIYSEIKTRE